MMNRKRPRATKTIPKPDWAEWEKISNFNQLDLEYDKFVYVCEDCRAEHGLFDIKDSTGDVNTYYKCKRFLQHYALNGGIITEVHFKKSQENKTERNSL